MRYLVSLGCPFAIVCVVSDYQNMHDMHVFVPRTYSSPIHQHGGCAGSVRVVHGKLACKLYDSVLSEKPMTFREGDCRLDSLDPQPQEVLTLQAGQTTWLNRQSWSVHAVECSNDAAIEPPDFTLSIHFYKSCTDEFAFVADGPHGKAVKKAQPKNDLFWNRGLEPGHKHFLEHYEDDKGEKIPVPDFEKEASLGWAGWPNQIRYVRDSQWS